jgi:hypothetical protein
MGVPLMARTDPRPHYGRKRRIRTDGYVDVFEPDHPLARRDGYVFEHRKVLWDAGLLVVDRGLDVHHRNGCRGDNRVENLEVVRRVDHPHRHELAGWARENSSKTHCKHGHALTEDNLYRYGRQRVCRRCALDRARARRLGLR